MINMTPDTESQKRRAAAWLAEKVKEEFAKQGGWAIPFAIKDKYTMEQVIRIGINFMYNRDRQHFELCSHAGDFFLTHMLRHGVIEGDYVQTPIVVAAKQKEAEKAAKKVNPFIDAPEDILNIRYNAILNPTSTLEHETLAYASANDESGLNQILDPWEIYSQFMHAIGKDPGPRSSPKPVRRSSALNHHPSNLPNLVVDGLQGNKYM